MRGPFPRSIMLLAIGFMTACSEGPESFTGPIDGVSVGSLVPSKLGQHRFEQVRAGYHHTCGLTTSGVISCWGGTPHGEANAPDDGGFVQVAANRLYAGVTCGLRVDGSLQCWGIREFGSAPAHRTAATGKYMHVSTSGYHTCAVRDDGRIECFGDDFSGNVSAAPPEMGFVRVSANAFSTCALKTDGAVVCWGTYALGEVPSGPFVQVTAGTYHACGLRPNGTIECWGSNHFGQLNVPNGVYSDVEAGEYHVCAIRTPGRTVCWGRSNTFDRLPRGTNHLQVTTGGYHNCLLQRGAMIACWGATEYSAPSGPGKKYAFAGFDPPLAGTVEWSVVDAGRAIPVAFHLDGEAGSNVVAPGYPQVAPVSCAAPEQKTVGWPIMKPGDLDIKYDASSAVYSFEWRTERSWEGSCLQIVIQLADGTFHRSNIRFR